MFGCDTCGEPIFLKFVVRAYTALRVELASSFMEIERARENFPLTYLPEEAEGLFKEALNCYSASCFNAFGAMSRRTAQSLFRELGERGKLELFDTLQEIRGLANLDDDTFAACVPCCSAATPIPGRINPTSMRSAPGILLEVMRDLLYQTFVRKARLVQAVTFRRFVAPAAADTRQPAVGTLLEPRQHRASRRAINPRIPARCGTAASSRRLPPTLWAPRNSARCETPAPDAALAR